jgi:arginase
MLVMPIPQRPGAGAGQQVVGLGGLAAGALVLLGEGIDKLAIHVDLNVLEPADFPAIGWPSPGGLAPAVLVRTLRDLGRSFDVVGVGLTEYRPTELATVRDILGQLVAAVQR